MVTAFLIGAVLVGAGPAASGPALGDEDRVAYEDAKSRAGRDADAHVRLALWCESHGLGAERLEHLARAVLCDPTNAVARGLLGMVAYDGHWKHPEEVTVSAQSNDALQRTLAEYNGRREVMPETAEAHWALGLWCEQNGLKPEALAHFTAVTRIDPNRSDAWARLGCRKVGGRWLSEAQIAGEQAEANAQKRANERWVMRLKQWWKEWLADRDHRAESEAALGRELEPRAVPTIRALFDQGTTDQQLVAVSMYDRIDSPAATGDLSRFATMDRHPEVRQRAVEALTRRDPKEVIEPLISLMRAPMEVSVAPVPGGNGATELQVEDEQAILRKFYFQNNVTIPAPRGPVGPINFGFLGPVLNRGNNRTAQQQLARDLGTVARRNDVRQRINESARAVLTEITGQDQGPEQESWRRWLSEQQGYAYRSSTAPKPVYTRFSRHTQYQFASVGYNRDCFAKGTPVRTLLGPVPIETLRVGDQVLSENPSSGALSYQPVVVVYHNPPSPTLRINLGGEEVVVTPIHRFWRAGKGWALARHLEPGNQIRVLGGLAQVGAVDTDEMQPVFNFEVAGGHSFFVGRQGILVHDNSPIQPASEPFDAAPALTAVASRSR
jgi:hypothetical protein